MIPNIADIGLIYLRNMYETGLTLRQRNKRAKLCDSGYLTGNDFSYGQLHTLLIFPPCVTVLNCQ